MRDVSPTLLWSDPNPGQQFEYSHDERLIRMVARTSVGPQQRIDFTYDWQGRRIGKQVWNNVPDPTTEKYIYDGWNVLAQINGANQAVRSFLWGLDLSGTMQGAGGVGGLLAVNDRTTSTVSFPCYDGNGNVVGLVNTAGTSMTAQYEYGPFGEVIRATGPMAKANPFRFSTKYQDDETDFLYYGYRYYSASTGRWLSRDPIGEAGGPSLYLFALNDPQSKTDTDGRYIGWTCGACGQYIPAYGTHDCPGYPPPLPEKEGGFEMCRRDVLEEGIGDRVANMCCGGLHMFVRQKYFDEKGTPIYRGWGFDKSGPHEEASATGKILPTCAACTKSSRVMKYGRAIPADKATDNEIWECLKKVPPRIDYNLIFYNCRNYARQAAKACGLDCPNVGPPGKK